MNTLEISNFTKRYRDQVAVDDLSLSIKQGEFFGFLGKNGAGKTTTINAITGIATLTAGTITVSGVDVEKDYRLARTKVGLSPQEFNVDIFMTPTMILDYMAGYYGMRKPERRARIDELTQQFALGPYMKKEFRMLSGGYKRRVMIARALVHDPDLLILDEPTAGVDVELRRELWKYLEMLNKAGKTILLTSHYLEEVELLCNRIAIINAGKLVAIGDKSEFISGGRTLEHTYLEFTKEKQPS
ncbi:MAG: ABC transporter ATP-binding protein [Minisyncoccota bacterium]